MIQSILNIVRDSCSQLIPTTDLQSTHEEEMKRNDQNMVVSQQALFGRENGGSGEEQAVQITSFSGHSYLHHIGFSLIFHSGSFQKHPISANSDQRKQMIPLFAGSVSKVISSLADEFN